MSVQDLQIFAYDKVENASFLKEILSNQSDEDKDGSRYAIVDLALVYSSYHIKAAVSKLLLNESKNKMKTKTIATELLYLLSGTGRIDHSLTVYSISETSTQIAFIVVPPQASINEKDSVVNSLQSMHDVISKVKGVSLDISLLHTETYLTPEKRAALLKAFKVTSQEQEMNGYDLLDPILTRLATKDYL
jgi:tRNA threonylcarbamoyladenosine modification (KEOPS) complex Cgi121 subunit